MSTAETRGIDAHSPHHRRKWSKDNPPTMRIVLLGKSVSENSRVGNFILGRAAFDSEAPPDVVERVGGRLKDRHVILINSPQLLQTHISDHQITQTVRECVYLSDPGPHVIVLLLKHEQCSAEDQECVEKVLDSFSEQVYQHTMVLTTQEPTETNDILQKIIQKCCNKHFSLQGNSSPDDLLQTLEDIEQMNNGRHLDCAEASHKLLMNQHATERFSGGVKLNLVVCGSDGTLKSSISERILQQKDRRSNVDLHGHVISVVELPALFNTRLSEEEVMRQTLRCVSLCHPGVHAFLLIIPDAPLTDEDKAEMEEIQRIFGSRINKHIMILIMQNSKHQTAVLNEETKTVIESFGGRHNLFGPTTQVSTLMGNIEQMLEENSGEFFSSESFLEDIWRKYEEMKKKIHSLETNLLPQGSTESEDDLRIVLLGKTGVGKSETGNTILGRQAFKAEESFESVTSEGQRETSEINGRRVTVIDTPGLFDTELSNEEIQREIKHCISMILPGPHAFLLLIPLGRFTKEEQKSMKIIQEMFGEKSLMFTIVLFTRGDFLKNKTIDQCLGKPGSVIRNLTEVCGNRYHVFNNNQTGDRTQVSDLLQKIDNMVNANGGSFYSCKMFREMEREKQEQQMKILMDREREELMKKHEEEKDRIKIMMKEERQNYGKERKRREEEFREREEQYKREIKGHEMQMRDTMSREREEYEKQKLTATSAAIFGKIICQKLKEPIEQSVYKKTARDLTYELMKNCESLNGNKSNLERNILITLAEEEDFDKYTNYIHNPRDHYKSFIRNEVSRYICDKFSVSVLPKMKENIELLQQKIMKAAHESTEHVQEYRGDVGLWLKSFTQQLSDVLIFSVKDLRAVKHDDVDVKLLEDVIREELPTIMSEISKTFNENTFPVKLDYKERPDEILIDHFCQCCWVQCPFCGAVCTNNIGNHHGDHSVPFHRNIGLNKIYYRSTSNLSTHICTSAVESKTLYFHPNDSDKTVLYRDYRRAGGVYAKWSITSDLSELPYWKWFVCRFQKDLEKYYNKTFDRSGKILDEWRKYSKQDAIKSLGRYI